MKPTISHISRLFLSLLLSMVSVLGMRAYAQTPPSLTANSLNTCGSPIAVTANCQPSTTAIFAATGGTAMGNVYTFTAVGNYTLSATCQAAGGANSAPAPTLNLRINTPTAPPTLTPSSATVVQGGAPVIITTSGCTGGYISYFGTNGVNRDGSITVPTGTTGVITISAICTLNNCRSDAAVANITVRPSSAPVPTPTVTNPIPSQTGTVGTTFTYLIPLNTFSDPNNDPLTLTATGLPAGFFFNGLILTGPLTTEGTSTVTVTASNNRGGSVSTNFQLVAVPGAPTSTTGGPLRLLTPTYDPCTRIIVFNTTGGNGTPITYTAIGVRRDNNQSNTGVVESEVIADNKVLNIQATQSGITTSISFTPPVCSTPPTSTTTIGGPLQLLPPTYDACTRAIIFNTTGGNGSPITYTAIGVQRSSPQSNVGVVELGVALDGKTLFINATQNGVTVAISFPLPLCGTTPPPTSTTTVGTAFQMLPPTYDPCTRVIVVNTTGGNGTPITYSMVGVQRTSPQSNSGVVELGVVLDNKTLTLVATQSGQSVSMQFSPPRCSSARLQEGMGRTPLSITVFGNPTNGQDITIDVTGAQYEMVQVRLVDPNGQSIHEQKLLPTTAVERVVIPVRSSLKGVFIIQAVSGRRSAATKVIHQ